MAQYVLETRTVYNSGAIEIYPGLASIEIRSPLNHVIAIEIAVHSLAGNKMFSNKTGSTSNDYFQ